MGKETPFLSRLLRTDIVPDSNSLDWFPGQVFAALTKRTLDEAGLAQTCQLGLRARFLDFEEWALVPLAYDPTENYLLGAPQNFYDGWRISGSFPGFPNLRWALLAPNFANQTITAHGFALRVFLATTVKDPRDRHEVMRSLYPLPDAWQPEPAPQGALAIIEEKVITFLPKGPVVTPMPNPNWESGPNYTVFNTINRIIIPRG